MQLTCATDLRWSANVWLDCDDGTSACSLPIVWFNEVLCGAFFCKQLYLSLLNHVGYVMSVDYWTLILKLCSWYKASQSSLKPTCATDLHWSVNVWLDCDDGDVLSRACSLPIVLFNEVLFFGAFFCEGKYLSLPSHFDYVISDYYTLIFRLYLWYRTGQFPCTSGLLHILRSRETTKTRRIVGHQDGNREPLP